MKTNRYILMLALAVALTFAATSCRENELIADDVEIPGLGGYEYQQNELDGWLYENFTRPYNINVYYRWAAVQQINDFSKKLVPAKQENIKPMMDALKRVWFEPFLVTAPYGFLQQLAPKTIVLAGSYEYNQGSITLGTAEGARKIWLTGVNHFDPSNEAAVKSSLHVILHEFCHILHQTRMYDLEYTALSMGRFDAKGLENYTDADANTMGFITAYSMTNSDEDFVETISNIAVYGSDLWNSAMTNAVNGGDTYAAAILQAKLAFIDQYMLDVWDIRFLDSEDEDGDGQPDEIGLVTRIQEAIADLMANPVE